MGNGIGKDDKKKVAQVNKSNSYPQTKRGRRQTFDGIPPHLNLEVDVTKKEKGNKYSTGNFKDPKLQQQLAELKLGETIGGKRNRKNSTNSANGRDGSDPQLLQETIARKKGSKLHFLHNSLKRNKTYPFFNVLFSSFLHSFILHNTA